MSNTSVNSYLNPIIPGFYPDPSICRVGKDYYLVTSSFEYFPGVPIFHSLDLVNWEQIGYCLTRDEQLPLETAGISGGIYAPALRFYDGTFYMTTTNVRNGGNFIVTATDPAGEWSDPIWVDQDGIDPDIFFDHDGTCYYTSSGRAGGSCRIIQSVIDPQSGKFIKEPYFLWSGSRASGAEGPHLYWIKGKYYLMIAEGGTEYGHLETIARSNSPSGPWEICPHNPILSNRSTNRTLQGTGHADLIEAGDGSWWLVHLAFRTVDYHRVHLLGRETCLTPVSWDENDWPVIGENGQAAAEVAKLPAGVPQRLPGSWQDDFNEKELGFDWNFLGNPNPDNWSLTEQESCLTLFCRDVNLDSMIQPAWLGCRQRHLDCQATVKLSFDPEKDGEEAGLSAFQNNKHHYEIAVLREDSDKRVIVRRRIGSLSKVVAQKTVSANEVYLRINAEPTKYSFSFSEDGTDYQELAEGESRYLSTEVGGRFTGVYFAMYATGNSQTTRTSAHFDWFDYQITKQ